MLSFGLLGAHLFLGSFPHSFTYGPLLSFAACGPNSARGYSRPICGLLIRWAVFIASSKYGRLTTARYGRPMNVRFQLQPIYGHNVFCYWTMFGQPIISP